MVRIDVLESGYAPIFRKIADWGKAHKSVQAMFFSGSIAKGTADGYSDLDLVIVAKPADVELLLDEGRTVIHRAERLILENCLTPGQDLRILSVVTEKWHRVDLAIGTSDSGVLRQTLVPIFDPDEIWDGTFTEAEPEPVGAEEVIKLTTEFLRILGLSAVVNGRGDVHAGHDGANLLRNMLVELLLMESPRSVRPSPKKLLPALNSEQRAVLKGLPPVADDLEMLNTFSGATARVFLARARALTDSVGGVWPAAMEQATRAYLKDILEI